MRSCATATPNHDLLLAWTTRSSRRRLRDLREASMVPESRLHSTATPGSPRPVRRPRILIAMPCTAVVERVTELAAALPAEQSPRVEAVQARARAARQRARTHHGRHQPLDHAGPMRSRPRRDELGALAAARFAPASGSAAARHVRAAAAAACRAPWRDRRDRRGCARRHAREQHRTARAAADRPHDVEVPDQATDQPHTLERVLGRGADRGPGGSGGASCTGSTRASAGRATPAVRLGLLQLAARHRISSSSRPRRAGPERPRRSRGSQLELRPGARSAQQGRAAGGRRTCAGKRAELVGRGLERIGRHGRVADGGRDACAARAEPREREPDRLDARRLPRPAAPRPRELGHPLDDAVHGIAIRILGRRTGLGEPRRKPSNAASTSGTIDASRTNREVVRRETASSTRATGP